MKLAWKLFFSYMIVVLVGGIVLAKTTSYIATQAFSTHVHSMHNLMSHHMQGNETAVVQLEEELNTGFAEAVNNALLVSSLAAVMVAILLSSYVSQRITQPLRQLAQASQRIAQGHYGDQLAFAAKDELGELTHSFNQMAQALAQTELLRQQLVADISHELKTPLAGLRGYLEGLEDGVLPATSQTYQTLLQEVGRLQRLVHDLQELSRAEAGQLGFESQAIDLQPLIQAVRDWLQPQFEGKQVQLMTELPAQPIQVQGDYDRLRQVLLNLLGNALQYTPSGGQVAVRLRAESGQIHLQIQDSGLGLVPTDIDRIFQRFYRVEKSRARESGGSGIGLTIARHIVEGLGGKIWAESAGLQQGCTFHVTLPT